LAPEPFYKRFSFGVRGGAMFFDALNSQTITESTTQTDPATSTINFSNSASKRFTGGPAIHFRVSDHFGLNLDVLYKRAGYDAGDQLVTQPTEDEEADDLASRYERTRADYWDIPVLARYYTKAPDEEGPRYYLTGGIAFRSVSGIKTFSEVVSDEGLSDTNSVAVKPANKNTAGAVAGIGLQLRDEVGLKVDLEARYTRWFRPVFDSGPTSSNLNQGEFVLGFTF
jgi:opacity protein-like surface antigen